MMSPHPVLLPGLLLCYETDCEDIAYMSSEQGWMGSIEAAAATQAFGRAMRQAGAGRRSGSIAGSRSGKV